MFCTPYRRRTLPPPLTISHRWCHIVMEIYGVAAVPTFPRQDHAAHAPSLDWFLDRCLYLHFAHILDPRLVFTLSPTVSESTCSTSSSDSFSLKLIPKFRNSTTVSLSPLEVPMSSIPLPLPEFKFWSERRRNDAWQAKQQRRGGVWQRHLFSVWRKATPIKIFVDEPVTMKKSR
ncbi:uncharacterized protein DS421_4g113560 [Arachis hypogaea]|nr:uncharacterized protein DS421_4g113560 [Arachis hypogaea]